MRRGASILLVVALAFGVVACGDDGDDATGDTTVTGGAGATDGTAVGSDGGLTVVEDGLDPELSAALSDAGAGAFAETSAPGAVMAIRTPEGTWVATVGHQDPEGATPMTADLNQRIGSVTKTFTVTALLQLAEEGLVSLDDPIEDYVPGMPNGHATLAELASMRSGIPSYTFDEEFQERLFSDPATGWTPQELVDLVADEEPMFEPGTAMFYSNTNTVLLGMVIEEVTGEPVEGVFAEQIFEPLGLDATIMPTDATFPEPHPQGITVQGADDGEPQDATDWNPSWGWTAGAMISDLDDMLTWGEALATGEGILSPESQTARLDSFDFDVPVVVGPDTTVPQGPELAYGLGMGLALGWYGHEGELPGFNTYVQHHLDEGVTLVVLVNSDIASGEDCDEEVATADNPKVGPCSSPASRIGAALAAALGLPMAEDDGEDGS